MPILSINGSDAVRIRKKNKVAIWGNRADENRVEPVTRPAFEVPFQLRPKEKIFTIGSCFARHVEDELMARGYRIPVRDLFRTVEFEGLGAEIVNNFGTPSIYNELAWASGVDEFDEELGFVEVSDGKWVDLHMVSSVRPAPLEAVRARRNGLLRATRSFADCRVVIMTLGLVELWWDERAACYLNTAPLPSVMRREPDRFALHVLSFEECHDYLSRAFDIVFTHGHDDVRVILTVSPVPMMATHRDCDVITANSYSKSVLRSVAEHIVAAHENVTYFPSFETVTLSNRRAAWDDDLVHVQREMVAFNVERMANAYTGQAESESTFGALADDDEEESGEALLLAEKARHARVACDAEFFRTHADRAQTSPSFAIEYARYRFKQGDIPEALNLVEDRTDPEAQLLKGEILLEQEKYEQAIEAAERVAETGNRSHRHWQLMLDAAAALEDRNRIFNLEQRWHTAEPRRSSLINAYVARALVGLSLFEEAQPRSDAAMVDAETLPFFVKINRADIFIAKGEEEEALALLDTVEILARWHANQVERCRNRAVDSLEARSGVTG